MSYRRRNYTLESDSPQHYSRNVANMPIFEDTSESYNRSSRHFSSDQHSLSEKYGPASTPPNSSALQALQNYGSTFSTDMLSSVREKPDIEKQGKDLNTLNSVDEEDEFLYGDSNSLPEEPKSLLNNSEVSVNRNNSGWSDEDDCYVESTIYQTNLNSNVKNNPVMVRNEKNLPKASHKTLGEKSSTTGASKMFSEKKKSNSPEIVHSAHSSVKTIKGSNVSPYTRSINVVEKDTPINTYVPDVPATGTKSKYHAAAQILKKQTEKHDLRSKLNSLNNNRELYNLDRPVTKRQEHPRIELSNKPTGKRTVVLPQSLRKSEEKELSSNSRTSSFVENQRHAPKYFHPKELDNIKNYLKDSSRINDSSSREHLHELKSSLKGPKDISPGRHHSPSFESSRVHTRCISRSPSLESSRINSRHRSPYSSRHRSPDYKYKYRSPPRSLRHKSPLDDINKPSYEYRSKYAIVRDRSRRYSRSPIRRSLEKSPEYHKRRNRSQSRPREKSKSPVYHSSRDRSPRTKYRKTAEDSMKKNTSYERTVSSKRRYSKDGRRSRSSSSSFCSLSFESHSLSSDSLSEGSAHEKKDSKKSEKSSYKEKRKLDRPKEEKLLDKFAIKSADVIPSKCEVKSENVAQSNTANKNSEKQGDLDLLKNLSAEDKEFYNVVNNVFDGADIVNALIKAQQTGMDYVENAIPTSKMDLPNPPMPFSNEDVSNTLAMSNQPMPEMPFSQLFPFNPAMHPMPHAPYPPVNNYPPLMPSPMLPPHVSASPYYNPYIMPEMNVEMDYPLSIEPMPSHNKRTVTLRSIPVTDNLDIAPAVINVQPSLLKPGPKPSDSSPEKKKSEAKEKNAPKTQLTTLKKESKLQENSMLLECYKKLKAERYYARAKINQMTRDIIEIKSMIDEAWGKKFNMDPSDKILQGKCQSILSLSSLTLRQNIDEAKQFDEERRRVKDKLPKELVAEVAKLSIEDHVTEPQIPFNLTYMFPDSGKHVCSFCNKFLLNVTDVLEHLHSPLHKQSAVSENYWIKDFRKKPNDEKATVQPATGMEFIKPTSGFYCTLCKEHSIDHVDAEYHITSSDHRVKYENHIKDNPLFENKCNVKKYVGQSAAIRAMKEKRVREIEEKGEQLAKRRKEDEAADEKVKEKIKDQQSKEKNVVELEETDADKLASNNQKLSGIKLTLSGDKLKAESNTKEKPVQKFVYIGRAPNYKPAAKKSRPLPWYKRDALSEKPDSNQTSSNSDIVKKLKERIASKSSTSASVDVEKGSKEKISVPLYEVPLPVEKPSVGAINHSKEKNSTLSSGTPSANKSLFSGVIKEKNPSLSTEVASSTNVSPSLKDINKLSGKSSTVVKKYSKATTPKKDVAYTCLTEKESKNLSDNNAKNKEFYGPVYEVKTAEVSEPKSLNSENNDKTKMKSRPKVKTASSSTSNIKNVTKSSKITDVSSLTKKNPIKSDESKTSTPNKDPAVNQAIKNILYGTDSTALPHIPLTEIKLPEITKIPDSSQQSPISKSVNEPTPKDISPVNKDISSLKIKLPEVPDLSQPPPSLFKVNNINEPTPMDISPNKNFQMEFPDVSQPPPLIRETINESTPMGFISQPPPLLLINNPTPIDNPPIRNFQIGFPDVSQPPPPLPRDTVNEATLIRNFQNVPPQTRKFSEEENDFMILGINKNDFMPLVIPVPPPLSLLHHSSYVRNVAHAESPAFSPPNIRPGLNKVQVSSAGTIKVIQNSTTFPQTKSSSFKKQTLKSYTSNLSNLITISPDEKVFIAESKDLKYEKTLLNSETKVVQYDTPISNVEENEKDKLPKSLTNQLASAEMKNSMESQCDDVIKDEVRKQSSESEVEFVPVASKQFVAPESVDCSKSIKKLQIEDEIQKSESKLGITAIGIKEDEKGVLKRSCSEQLPPLKVQNSMKSDCNEIKQEPVESDKIKLKFTESDKIEQKSFESEMTELITVASEAANVSENKNEESQIEDSIKKSDESKLDVAPEKIEKDQTGKLKNSSVDHLPSLEFEKYMRHEHESIKDKEKAQESEVMEIVTVMSKKSPVQKGEKILITMKCVKSENVDCGSQIKESQEAEVENSALITPENKLYDAPANIMEESHADSIEKSDIGNLGSLEVEKNMGSDCEVAKNELQEVFHDSEMKDLTCTSLNSVESEKESVMDIASATIEISLTSERVAISEKKFPQIEGEIKKDEDQSPVTLETVKSVDSFSEIKITDNITLVAYEGPAASKSVTTEKTGVYKLPKSNIKQLVSSKVENMISECDKVKVKLHGSEVDNSLVSQNSVEFEKESNMELADAMSNDSISSEKASSTENKTEGEVKKFEELSQITLENVYKCIDLSEIKESQESENSLSVAAENYSASKFSDIAVLNEIKSEKLKIEKLVLFKAENNLSSESNMELADAISNYSISPEKVSSTEKESEGEIEKFKALENLSKCIDLSEIIESQENENSIPVAAENYRALKSPDIAVENEIKSEESNMELADTIPNYSISSEKVASTEKKSEGEVAKFEALENVSKCIDLSEIIGSQENENSIPVAAENYGALKSSDIAVENEIKSEKLNIEKLVSLEPDNNSSSECITIIKNEDRHENAPTLKYSVEEKIDEPKKSELDKSLLLSSANSAESECSADKNAVDKPSSGAFLQVEDQYIKDNDVNESNLISMEQHETVSKKITSHNVFKSNECSLDSEKSVNINNNVELPILEDCQEERYVEKHKICNSKIISSVNMPSSNDLNVSSQSVVALETMPVLTSENASKSSDVIKHEQSSSVQQYDPPVLESESLKSTEKVDEKLVINTQDSLISENKIEPKASTEIFSSAEENLLQDSSLTLLETLHKSVLKLSKISDSNKSTAMEQDLSPQVPLDGKGEKSIDLPESVFKLDPICKSSLSKNSVIDSSKNDSTTPENLQESNSKTDACKIMQFEEMTETDCSNADIPVVQVEEITKTQGDNVDIVDDIHMDCSPILETDGVDTGLLETGDKTSPELTSKSQEQVMQFEVLTETDGANTDIPVVQVEEMTKTHGDGDNADISVLIPDKMDCSPHLETDGVDAESDGVNYFLSLLSDGKIGTKVSKNDGSDTDEYNEE